MIVLERDLLAARVRHRSRSGEHGHVRAALAFGVATGARTASRPSSSACWARFGVIALSRG
jgi:hypothetical protein